MSKGTSVFTGVSILQSEIRKTHECHEQGDDDDGVPHRPMGRERRLGTQKRQSELAVPHGHEKDLISGEDVHDRGEHDLHLGYVAAR